MADPVQYRRFRERPNLIFVNQMRDLIQQTGIPEVIPELYRGQISRDERFYRLAEVQIPKGRRPNGDKAPCPRCVPNKFMTGVLAYFPRLEAVALIGHCCADAEALAEADREQKQRTTRDIEESYLLAQLPRVAERLRAMGNVLPVAKEAKHVFDLFHGRAEPIQRQLREIKARGGMLVLYEELNRGTVNDGPRAFGSSGNVREVGFGAMVGGTALIAAYNPVRDIEKYCERVNRFNVGESENDALEFIVKLSEQERALAYTELQECDRFAKSIVKKLADFASFFSDGNVQRLAAWGTHPLNTQPLEIETETEGTLRVVRFIGSGCRVRLMISPILWMPLQA
jgi:hypothetical protein